MWESEVVLFLQEACGEHLGSVCVGMQLGPACGGCLSLPLPGTGPAHIPEGLGDTLPTPICSQTCNLGPNPLPWSWVSKAAVVGSREGH